MLKTRKEIFKWLLEKKEGTYDELIENVGREMAKDLEVLGYIHKGYYLPNEGAKEGKMSWGLTERGKRIAELLTEKKKGEKKYSIIDIMRKILF